MITLHFKVTDEIELKTPTLEMAEAIFNTIDNNRAYLDKWMPWTEKTKQVSDTEAFIKGIPYESYYDANFPLSIWYKGEYAGMCGYVRGYEVAKQLEIGYWLRADFQGNGIITKCTKFLIDYAFEEIGADFLEIKCATKNYKSQAIPKRLGLKYVGIRKDDCFGQGEVVDSVVFVAKRGEWLTT